MEEYTGLHPNPSKNPNYETAGDTVSTLNLTFHAEVTRGLVAALATLGDK